jgi:hypothetical protein
MSRRPDQKSPGKKKAVSASEAEKALADVTSALDRHSLALHRHSLALDRHSLAVNRSSAARSAANVASCILNSLHLPSSALAIPFEKLWPYDISDPIDHIDDACRPNNCYPLSRMELHNKMRGKNIDTLEEFIKNL